MFGAVRLGDRVVKTCPFRTSGPFISASRSSFVNGRGQVRVKDKAVPGIAITGSSRYFCEGRPAVRQKDKVICGVIVSASRDTFIY